MSIVQFFLFTDFCKYFTVKCIEFEISKHKIVSIFDKIIIVVSCDVVTI